MQPSVRKKLGVKSKRVYPKRNYPEKRGMSVKEALAAGGSMPNMSRRPPTNVLVAFPTFDRCDSLLFFPTSFARLLNTADTEGLVRLLSTHMHKECQINAIFGSRDRLCVKGLVTYTDIANEIEPDRIMCVHSTKVVENQIRSTVYMKQTDSQPLYNMMSNTLRGSGMDFSSIIRRSDRFSLYDKDSTLSSEAVQQLMYHASLEEDLVLYLRCEFVLTFDDVTKKVVAMDVVGRLTSAHPVRSMEAAGTYPA